MVEEVVVEEVVVVEEEEEEKKKSLTLLKESQNTRPKGSKTKEMNDKMNPGGMISQVRTGRGVLRSEHSGDRIVGVLLKQSSIQPLSIRGVHLSVVPLVPERVPL